MHSVYSIKLDNVYKIEEQSSMNLWKTGVPKKV